MVFLVFGRFACLAADSAALPSPPPSGSIVDLTYTETPYSVNNLAITLTEQATPFKHEPLPGGKTIRGALNFGAATNSIAFFWQRDAGKLFLDLNQNPDLTNDPAGVFPNSGARSYNYQTFTNIPLALRTPAGAIRVVADLAFFNYGPRPTCSAALHSFWQGRVTLGGQDWQVGLVPDFTQTNFCAGGGLLLRPWARRDEPFSAGGNTYDALPFSPKVFVAGRAYQVRCLPAVRGAEFSPSLQWTERTVPLGDLKVTGRFIRRLVLTGGDSLVICERPAEMVKVPTGAYSSPRVLLEQNGAQAFCTAAQSVASKSILVTGQGPAVLAVGGPLTNSVSTMRRGEDLVLSYQLLGAGGGYQMVNVDRSKPPAFAVYQGQKQIAAGSFEFG
jgi:hypothetical protein